MENKPVHEPTSAPTSECSPGSSEDQDGHGPTLRPQKRRKKKKPKAPAKPLTSQYYDGMLATQVTDNLEGLVQANRLEASAKTSQAAQEEKPIFDDFRIIRKVGEGAMATVYQARQVSVGREVALKVLLPHTARNPRLVERFYLEGRILMRLDHVSLVRGYTVGEEHGLHYFAMEFVDGRTLQKWLNLLGKFSVGDALHIALACARALEYAHHLDLAHRDIKPDNILITRVGGVKITDLGVVKQVGDELSLTQTGNGIGTPCYMPLEQARNAKDTDGRCDIYALGCVLYCMLTGRPPFVGDNIVELLHAKQAGTFTPARRFNDAVPERLDLIIDKMVAKQVKFRYQTCAEVIKDLSSLRLANASLSFIPVDSSTTPPPKDPAEVKPPAPPPPAPKPTKSQQETLDDNSWYVCYKTIEGKMVTRQMSTAEVLKMIDDEGFDLKAKVSKGLMEGFRSLASIKEFEPALRSRITRKMADQKTSRFRSLYKKIADEDLERHKQASANDPAPDLASNWPLYLYYVAALAVMGGLGYGIVRLVLHSFSG
jgi:serine/threonine-protein kinase